MLLRIQNAFSFPELECESSKRSAVCQVDKTTIFRKFRKNRKNDHFLQSSTLKMVGLLQLKLPTSTPAGFLINGLIMNLLQYIFPQAENLVFQFPKSRGRIFLCVSPTFASPIEKPATSALRRICREIIENTEGNAKTVDSLRRCKWTNSTSKSAPKTKKPTRGPVGGESKKWSGWRESNSRPLVPQTNALTRLRYIPNGICLSIKNMSHKIHAFHSNANRKS